MPDLPFPIRVLPSLDPAHPLPADVAPLLADYADLKDPVLRAKELAGGHDTFIAEGPLTAEALLTSRFAVKSLLCTPAMLTRLTPALTSRLAAGKNAPEVLVVDEKILQSVVGFPFHRGCLAAGVRPALPTLAQLAAHATSLTILEGVNNPDNMGGLFRCVHALGGERPAVVLAPGCCDPLYRKAVRVSIGHVFAVAWTRVGFEATAARAGTGEALGIGHWASAEGRAARGDVPAGSAPPSPIAPQSPEPTPVSASAQCPVPSAWPGILTSLPSMGFAPIALTPHPAAPPLAEVAAAIRGKNLRPALLLGAEGPGLTDAALAHAAPARIPMTPGVDSLNVFVAGAVALYELGR